jgi:triacylglycerol lipase
MSHRTQHIFLIPGFLGIENLGEVIYFGHVREFLARSFQELGIDVRIHAVRNYATSSVRKRTLRLAETIAKEAGPGDEPLHLIGHSTGGLDARLLCTPGASLGAVEDVEPLARRVRTIVTVATPHRGTPLASFFTTRFGAQLLGVLSLGTLYVLRFGRLPLTVVIRLATLFVHLHGRLGRLENTVADQLFDQMLGDFSADRRDELAKLFRDIAQDQALMPQLMPDSMDIFEAAVGDRTGIRCGCVVATTRPVSLRGVFRVGLDPYAQSAHALFGALRRLVSAMNDQYLPVLTQVEIAQLEQAFGAVPTAQDNDGIVPSLSQVWGEMIHLAVADHFDVIGHFAGPQHVPPHYDWLASGSRFDRSGFERVWRDVTHFIVRG